MEESYIRKMILEDNDDSLSCEGRNKYFQDFTIGYIYILRGIHVHVVVYMIYYFTITRVVIAFTYMRIRRTIVVFFVLLHVSELLLLCLRADIF